MAQAAHAAVAYQINFGPSEDLFAWNELEALNGHLNGLTNTAGDFNSSLTVAATGFGWAGTFPEAVAHTPTGGLSWLDAAVLESSFYLFSSSGESASITIGGLPVGSAVSLDFAAVYPNDAVPRLGAYTIEAQPAVGLPSHSYFDAYHDGYKFNRNQAWTATADENGSLTLLLEPLSVSSVLANGMRFSFTEGPVGGNAIGNVPEPRGSGLFVATVALLWLWYLRRGRLSSAVQVWK